MSQDGIPQAVLDGVTVDGARAFWALKDLERRHEALRVAVMVVVSDPHMSGEEARRRLRDALNQDTGGCHEPAAD